MKCIADLLGVSVECLGWTVVFASAIVFSLVLPHLRIPYRFRSTLIRITDNGWLPIKVSMAGTVGLIAWLWHQQPHPNTTIVDGWVLAVGCVGVLLCFAGAIFTVVANEVRVPLTDETVRNGRYLLPISLLTLAQGAWMFGFTILMLWPSVHPELLTATAVAE